MGAGGVHELLVTQRADNEEDVQGAIRRETLAP